MDRKFLYLSFDDVNRVNLTMKEVIAAVEAGFTEMGHGRAEMPPKNAIHPGAGGDNYIHGMPCYIPAMKSAGVKWVAGYPGNLQKGLPYNTGLLALNDVEDGVVYALMDCRWITTKRTGAASAISAKYLARPESSTIAVIACGVQGHSNLEAMSEAFKLQKVRAYDPLPAQAEKLVAYARSLGLEAEATEGAEKAVRGADIVVSSGPIFKQPYDAVREGWMEEGAFASLVDFDSSWSRAALAQADKWTTDNIGQYRHYQDLGYFQNCPEIYGELGEIVVGQKKGRETAQERTFAANLGLALDDMAVAPLIYAKAKEMGVGVWLPL
ncbi:MAG: ornithine cyclodeaminase family protein [Deltaproteobacteria bacterium]|jgi:ornithine cyclodeaminase/alanine dehydrogenase|nr:ornithine cyclodeaminase family protein [Deltaproteobacteria bacterium]